MISVKKTILIFFASIMFLTGCQDKSIQSSKLLDDITQTSFPHDISSDKSIDIQFNNPAIDMYQYTLSSKEKDTVNVIYATADHGQLNEQFSYKLDLDTSSVITLTLFEKNILILSLQSKNNEEIYQFNLVDDVDTDIVQYNLIENVNWNKKDILLFLKASNMRSIQSDVYDNWRNFDGDMAEAIILSDA